MLGDSSPGRGLKTPRRDPDSTPWDIDPWKTRCAELPLPHGDSDRSGRVDGGGQRVPGRGSVHVAGADPGQRAEGSRLRRSVRIHRLQVEAPVPVHGDERPRVHGAMARATAAAGATYTKGTPSTARAPGPGTTRGSRRGSSRWSRRRRGARVRRCARFGSS